MTIKEIQAFFEQNKEDAEVKQFISTITPKTDFKQIVATDPDARSWYLSQIDSAVSRGVNSFKENNLKKIIDEEMAKRGTENETQRMIRELKEDNDRRDREYRKEKLLNKALSYASEKKLPTKFIDKFVADDEPTTIANLEAFYNEFETKLKEEVDSRFAEGGRRVDNNMNKDQKGAFTSLTYEDIKNMSAEELTKNAEAIKRFTERQGK